MHLVDHILILLLFVAQPLHGAQSFRRYIRKIEAGEPVDRVREYRFTMLIQWLVLAGLAVTWYVLRRPVADLGLVAPGGVGFYAGIVVLALVCAYLVSSWRNAKQMTIDEKAKQAATLGDLAHVLPRNEVQFRNFAGLSITAGVVEEILYRGFSIWYLAQFMPTWAAIIATAVFFGLGHSYQGKTGMLQTGLVGLAFGVFYVLTGSIWLPIIAHALLDILQGRMIVEILRDSHQEDPASLQQAESTGN
jgi:membrane protease YdiL (CAAX protease family)